MKGTRNSCLFVFTRGSGSKQLAKLLGSQSCHLGDVAHGVGIDDIVPWHLHHHRSIRHRDVLALPDDSEPAFFQHPHRVPLTDARQPWHDSDCHDLVLDGTNAELGLVHHRPGFLILSDGFTDVRQGFLARRALRTASRQSVAPDRPTFVRLHEGDAVFHATRLVRSPGSSSWPLGGCLVPRDGPKVHA